MKQSIRTAIILALVFLSSACNVLESENKGAAELRAVEQRWEDALKLAHSTSRIALSNQVATLQSIRRDVKSIPVGKCLEPAGRKLSEHMDAMIDGFLLFMGNDEYTAKTKFEKAETLFEEYKFIRNYCTG